MQSLVDMSSAMRESSLLNCLEGIFAMPSKPCTSCHRHRPIFARSGECHECFSFKHPGDALALQKCSVEACDAIGIKSGMCAPHYRRFKKYGSPDKVRRVGRHPEYKNFEWLRRNEKLCLEWRDFDTFIAAIGERPSPRHRLERKDQTQRLSAANFYWRAPKLDQKYNLTTPDGRREYQRATRAQNEAYWVGSNLKRYYGLTKEDYAKMVAEHDGVCAICKRAETKRSKASGRPLPLSVDHDHSNGALRGLLCGAHNSMLGYAVDDPSILTSAIAYLAQHSTDRAGVLLSAINTLQSHLPVAGTA